MPTHRERRRLPWRPEQMFELVVDVARYPEFLPWCRAARILSREEAAFRADLDIGFKMFRESFTSRVGFERPRRIEVVLERGPFRHLHNRWRFEPVEDGGSRVDFDIGFEFRSPLMRRTMSLFFHEAVRRMVSAFEARARALYGPGVPAPEPTGRWAPAPGGAARPPLRP